MNLLSSYNYYTQAFSQIYTKPTTKYDTHKSTELKNIYKKMVSTNKQSPLYKITLSEDTQNYVLGIKSAAVELKNLSSFLSDADDPIYEDKTLYSSDVNFVKARLTTEDYSKVPQSLSFEVQSLATSQKNEGKMLLKDSASIHPGTYTFAITKEDETYHYQITTKKTDSNQTIMKNLRNFINQSDIGIKASIKYENDRCAMVLESERTGTEFQLSDISPSTGIVSSMRLNKIVSEASCAEFTINGDPKVSATNEITINNSIEIDLLAPTSKAVSIDLGLDSTRIIEKAKEFVSSYNYLNSLATEHLDTQKSAKRLLSDIVSVSEQNKDALERAGLMLEEDGSIRVDEALLVQGIESGEFIDLFADISSFKNDIIKKADALSLDPMSYVDKKLLTYPNFKHSFPNPYMPSMYTGMLYNQYV
ncbi:MAG: hypothetical protein IJA10_05280 [Lachnospiraceae bacterium]|nr:hypothetical protein [Lachnospiraceae bacterium]